MIEKLNRTFVGRTDVKCLHLDIDQQSCQYALLISLASDANFEDVVTFYFQGVKRLNLCEFGDGLSQFMHLKITELGANAYKVEDLEHQLISFECTSIDDLTS